MGGALEGVRVLELGGGQAVAWVGVLLADQGADVVRVAADVRTPSEALLARGRIELADASALDALARRADIVVGASVPRDLPGVVRCTLPDWATADARSGTTATEGLLGAAAGLHGLPGLPWPSFTAIPVASVLAALYAATASVAALLARARDGRGRHVDVPLFDAAVAAQGLAALMTDSPPPAWRTLQWAASPWLGAWRCADGRELYLHAGLAGHLERFLEVLQGAGMLRAVTALRRTLTAATRADPSSVATVGEAAAIRGVLAQLFAERSAEAWEDLLGEAGLAVSVVRSGAEWLAHPHATASGQVVTVEDPVWGAMKQPGVQVRLGSTPPVRARREGSMAEVLARWSPRELSPGAPVGVPLEGLRVLDVSQVIAGPMAARTLGELGAEVLRIENPRLGAAWAPAFHVAFNPGKRSVALDLGGDDGRAALARIVEVWRPDVVVHNFRRGVAERLRLGEASLREGLAGLVYVHIDAFGEPGPWAGRPGWEQTAQAATGIQLDAGDGRAELVPIPGNDLGTGLSGAFGAVLGLWQRERTGRGELARASLSATAVMLQTPWLFEPGRVAPRCRGTRSLGADTLDRYYRARDGWLYLAAERVDALEALEGLAGATEVDRRALEGWLEERIAGATVAEWIERLGAAGRCGVGIVPRGTVREVLRSPRLVEEGLVRRRDNRAVGTVTEVGSPLTIDGVRRGLGAAPPRGADTVAVLAEVGVALAAVPSMEERPVTSRARWLADQARWGLHLARTRIR